MSADPPWNESTFEWQQGLKDIYNHYGLDGKHDGSGLHSPSTATSHSLPSHNVGITTAPNLIPDRRAPSDHRGQPVYFQRHNTLPQFRPLSGLRATYSQQPQVMPDPAHASDQAMAIPSDQARSLGNMPVLTMPVVIESIEREPSADDQDHVGRIPSQEPALSYYKGANMQQARLNSAKRTLDEMDHQANAEIYTMTAPYHEPPVKRSRSQIYSAPAGKVPESCSTNMLSPTGTTPQLKSPIALNKSWPQPTEPAYSNGNPMWPGASTFHQPGDASSTSMLPRVSSFAFSSSQYPFTVPPQALSMSHVWSNTAQKTQSTDGAGQATTSGPQMPDKWHPQINEVAVTDPSLSTDLGCKTTSSSGRFKPVQLYIKDPSAALSVPKRSENEQLSTGRVSSDPVDPSDVSDNVELATSRASTISSTPSLLANMPANGVRIPLEPSEDDPELFSCVFPSCKSTFKKKDSIVRHVNTKHFTYIANRKDGQMVIKIRPSDYVAPPKKVRPASDAAPKKKKATRANVDQSGHADEVGKNEATDVKTEEQSAGQTPQ